MSKKNNLKQSYIEAVSHQSDFIYETTYNIAFNFKFFQSGKDSGQSFEEWEREKILADLNNKLRDFSGKTKEDMLRDMTLEIYNQYPLGSEFREPPALKSANIKWARFRITGRRRLIGFFLNNDKSNTFYVVFLDKNHMFAPSSR